MLIFPVSIRPAYRFWNNDALATETLASYHPWRLVKMSVAVECDRRLRLAFCSLPARLMSKQDVHASSVPYDFL